MRYRPARFASSCLLFLLALGASVLVADAGELLPPDRPVEEVVDHYVDARLQAEGISAASPAPDNKLLRRTLLDLVGRIPTAVEAQAFAANPEAAKRAQLVDQLLGSPAFVRFQAERFNQMLMPGNNANLREYLQAAFKENRPWNQMFREMMLGRDDDPEQKGPIQFVRSRAADLDKLTNDASALFFGVNISCAQCHDHPLVADWSQDHFYGMKSFFARTFDNGGLVGERAYGKLDYKTNKGESRNAKLMFLTGTLVEEPEAAEPNDEQKKEEKKQLDELKTKKLPPPLPAYSRRAKLVEMATAAGTSGEASFFARSIVNQVWHQYFGRGLVHPIDQMHSANPASHPELLDWLARDFAAHGYDLRRLQRGIVLSRAYARDSVWTSNERPLPETLAVAAIRPLGPQQYAMALRMAVVSPDQLPAELAPEEFEKRVAGIEGGARGLAGMFEHPGSDFQVSVDEALAMANGDRIERELLRDGGDMLLGKLQKLERPQAIALAGWTIFNRQLAAEETQAINAYLEARADRLPEAYRQVLWAMLSSGECRFNH